MLLVLAADEPDAVEFLRHEFRLPGNLNGWDIVEALPNTRAMDNEDGDQRSAEPPAQLLR